jgi:AcrR family transcriptional regulator
MAKSAKPMVASIQGPEVAPRLATTLADQRREAAAVAIENSALELFASRPMAQVTVDEAVAVRTLYRYFTSKEYMFTGLPRRGAERLARFIIARPEEEEPFEAVRNAMKNGGWEVNEAELDRWLKALAKSGASERIARLALAASTQPLSEALTQRSGLEPDSLWPSMAGTMIAGALTVATRLWLHHGGALLEHQLAALDIVGLGLDSFDAEKLAPRTQQLG